MGDPKYSKAELDNHSNQMNPNNDAYYSSRGLDWDEDDYDDRRNANNTYDDDGYDDQEGFDYSADGWDSSDY